MKITMFQISLNRGFVPRADENAPPGGGAKHRPLLGKRSIAWTTPDGDQKAVPKARGGIRGEQEPANSVLRDAVRPLLRTLLRTSRELEFVKPMKVQLSG